MRVDYQRITDEMYATRDGDWKSDRLPVMGAAIIIAIPIGLLLAYFALLLSISWWGLNLRF